VKLTTVGAPAPQVQKQKVTRADAPKVLEYNWGGFDMQVETRTHCWRHASDAVDPTSPPLHRNGWLLGGTFVSMFLSGSSR